MRKIQQVTKGSPGSIDNSLQVNKVAFVEVCFVKCLAVGNGAMLGGKAKSWGVCEGKVVEY